MQQLPDESVDLVVTSPPYNLLNSTGNGSRCWDGYDGHSDDMPHTPTWSGNASVSPRCSGC